MCILCLDVHFSDFTCHFFFLLFFPNFMYTLSGWCRCRSDLPLRVFQGPIFCNCIELISINWLSCSSSFFFTVNWSLFFTIVIFTHILNQAFCGSISSHSFSIFSYFSHFVLLVLWIFPSLISTIRQFRSGNFALNFLWRSFLHSFLDSYISKFCKADGDQLMIQFYLAFLLAALADRHYLWIWNSNWSWRCQCKALDLA